MLIRIFNKILEFVQNNRILKILLYFGLIIYPFLFIYLYNRLGLAAIGIHTNLIIPIYLILFFDFLKRHVSSFSNLFSQLKYFSTIYIIIEFFIILISPENIIVDRWYGQYYNYTAYAVGRYYHIGKPNEVIDTKTPEFKFYRVQNSLGLSDKEWSLEKPKDTYRIICLGDSFTEGDGVDYEHTYVEYLKGKLSKEFKNIEVLNAGKCGSDPFFNFKYLEDKLYEYQPDLILQSFTTNDYYYDFVVQGGMERFTNSLKLSNSNNHWWEPIYAASYTARILIQTIGKYDKYLIKTDTYEQNIEELKPKTIALFKEYQDFAKKHQFELVVFTLPFKSDLDTKNINKENEQFYHEFKKEFAKIPIPFYNLQACYEDYIKSHNASYKNYYWVKDGHHNPQGYEMMAGCIYDIILPILSQTNQHE